jgi:hypothetical protein
MPSSEPREKPEAPVAEPTFPETTRGYVPRLSRWEFLLTEMTKSHDQRSEEVKRIVQADTKFDLRFVTVGEKLDDGSLVVRSCDALGLAALDPVFHRWRLRPSVLPPYSTLDLGGVEMPGIKYPDRYVRVKYLNHNLPHFFGIRPTDWPSLTDLEWHRQHSGTVDIKPEMILDLLDVAIRRKYGRPLSQLRQEVAEDKTGGENTTDTRSDS